MKETVSGSVFLNTVYAEIAVGTCSLEISIGGRCVCVTDPG